MSNTDYVITSDFKDSSFTYDEPKYVDRILYRTKLKPVPVSEQELYKFKLNTELYNGLDNKVCQDKIREKSQNIGKVVYKVHNVLKNRARRRRKKAGYFSDHA